MTLRLKINLIVGVLMLLFVAVLIALQLRGMRDSVREEVVAANRVAAQLLERTAWRYSSQGTPAMLQFLQGVGRVRSNDITLVDAAGGVLYRSPPSPYKPGREAPAWFAGLVAPPEAVQAIAFPDGRLEVRSNASRAVLDEWDHFAVLVGSAAALLLAVNWLVYGLVGRTLRPFRTIVAALDALKAGGFDVVLPPLPGREAAAIGSAFNRMVGELRQHLETERRAIRAERQLSDSRALTRWIEQHVEHERRLIARELHDELGQSVTAMRSMALSIAQRVGPLDAQAEQAARLIADESSRLYDAMHGMIPRLAPLVLDSLGLADALADLVERTRRSQAAVTIESTVALDGAELSADAALTLYRAAQEGITNALRHGQARRIGLRLQVEQAAIPVGAVDAVLPGGAVDLVARQAATHRSTSTAPVVVLALHDDGCGLSADWRERPGHHGVRWLGERVQALGGVLRIEPAAPAGTLLSVTLPAEAPLPPAAAAPSAAVAPWAAAPSDPRGDPAGDAPALAGADPVAAVAVR